MSFRRAGGSRPGRLAGTISYVWATGAGAFPDVASACASVIYTTGSTERLDTPASVFSSSTTSTCFSISGMVS